MPDKEDEDLSESEKQLYRKTRVPHKFCPYCGHKNEADADRCANCGKDISWMKVPEAIPAQEPPFQKPRSMPEQATPVFTWRAILVFVLIILILIALVLVIYFTTRKSSKPKGAMEFVVAASGGARAPATSTPIALLASWSAAT